MGTSTKVSISSCTIVYRYVFFSCAKMMRAKRVKNCFQEARFYFSTDQPGMECRFVSDDIGMAIT